jgi:ParB/RepB/Spo0J family partition protein
VRQPKPDVQMLRNGDLIPSRNPRSYFDPAELAELTESIRIHRVQTPLLVRPLNGKFEIVFGERRWRANTAAFGADGELPCKVREMSDEETKKGSSVSTASFSRS